MFKLIYCNYNVLYKRKPYAFIFDRILFDAKFIASSFNT